MSTEQAMASLSVLWPCKGHSHPGICLQMSPQDVPVPARLVLAQQAADGVVSRSEA